MLKKLVGLFYAILRWWDYFMQFFKIQDYPFNNYITSHFEIAIDVKTIIIGHVLNTKYDQLLSFVS